MTTLNAIIRSIEKEEKYLRSLKPQIDSASNFVNRLMKGAQQVDDFIATLFRQNAAYAALALAVRWPPPLHVPSTFANYLVRQFEGGKLSESDICDAFVSQYSPEVLNELCSAWETMPCLSQRFPFLTEAMTNYLDGRYASASYVVLPQIEGVLGDYLGKKPKLPQDAQALFENSSTSVAARKFYTTVVLESFDWKRDSPVPELSRHAILHGRDVSFGTRANALKIILIFDMVATTIDDRGNS